MSAIIESFSPFMGSSGVPKNVNTIIAASVTTIILYIIAIALVFGITGDSRLGWLLIIIAVISLFLVSLYGVIGFALILAGGIAALKWKPRLNEKRLTPLDILKERYAKGELSKEEFESKRKDLVD